MVEVAGRWTMRVCDEHGERVGVGDGGEALCPRGHGVARVVGVPVVPCDAAAVGRACAALDEFDGRAWAGARRSEVVVAVLAAAGRVESSASPGRPGRRRAAERPPVHGGYPGRVPMPCRRDERVACGSSRYCGEFGCQL